MPTYPLLAIARTAGNPVIEQNTASFLWQGKEPVALIDDSHNWEDEPQPMVKTAPDLWLITLPFPEDGYIEYAFLDPKTGQRVEDPLNPNKVWNGINAYNHFFYMPKAQPIQLIKAAKGIPTGTVTRHEVQTREFAAGTKRGVYLYQPPVKKPVPLVVVYDGTDYLRRAKLNVIVDNLIAEKRIQPFAMAFVQNGGQARTLEYSCNEATVGLIFECVIPLAQEHLTLTPPGSEPYGIMGASLGGLMALYTGMRMPNVFGKVWMDAGRLEWLLEGNRSMYELLKEKKYKVKYHEFSGGHNYTAWQNDLWYGLDALFGK